MLGKSGSIKCKLKAAGLQNGVSIIDWDIETHIDCKKLHVDLKRSMIFGKRKIQQVTPTFGELSETDLVRLYPYAHGLPGKGLVFAVLTNSHLKAITLHVACMYPYIYVENISDNGNWSYREISIDNVIYDSKQYIEVSNYKVVLHVLR